MPKITRRQFTDAFKSEAVRLTRESGRPVAQVARELVAPGVLNVLDLVRMHADGGIDEGVLVGQGDCGLARGKVAADGDEIVHAGFARPRDHRLAVIVVAGIVEMGVSVDKHRGGILACWSG